MTTPTKLARHQQLLMKRILFFVFILAIAGMKFILDTIPFSSETMSSLGVHISTRSEGSDSSFSSYTSKDYAEKRDETILSCARWMDYDKRKILLVGLRPMETLSWMTEEYHLSLNLIHSILKLGFDLSQVGIDHFEKMEEEKLRIYHRIFVFHRSQSTEDKWSRHYDRHEIACKIRILFPDLSMDKEDLEFLRHVKERFHEKQLLDISSPGTGNTCLGYYPMLPKDIERPLSSERHQMGIISVPKSYTLSVVEASILQRLMKMNRVSIHVLYLDGITARADSATGKIVDHKNLDQKGIINLVSQSAFLLSFGERVQTPLPVISMSLGVSVIILMKMQDSRTSSQIPFVSNIGAPYAYNVNETDINGIIIAVQNSFSHRFLSHTIMSFGEFEDSTSPGVFEDRVCALLEDDSVCLCPDSIMDCRSSFHLMKRPPFSVMG